MTSQKARHFNFDSIDPEDPIAEEDSRLDVVNKKEKISLFRPKQKLGGTFH
jgi:hypothetical protein